MKRTKLNKILSMLVVSTVAFSMLAGCASDSETPDAAEPGNGEATENDKEYTFKLGYGGAVTNARHLAAEQFAEYVNEETDGRVTIDLYPTEMLGTDSEMAEMASMGNLDMTINAVGVVANYEPKIAIFELPFLFSSYEKVDQVLDSEFGQEILENLPSKGLRGLAYWENGMRHVTNSKKQILQPSDLNGLKIRTPENNMTLSIFNALGANPSPLAFSELYLALSQGSFDGQENPIANIHASKLYEVQPYLTMSNHKYEALVFLVSENVWQTIPADIQEVIATGAKEFGQVHRDMVRSDEDKLIAEMEAEGLTVGRPDLAAFQEATKEVYNEYAEIWGQEAIDEIVERAK